MYEPLRLSGTDPLISARITELLATASETHANRRSFVLRISWPGRPQPVAGHRPGGLGAVAGQRA